MNTCRLIALDDRYGRGLTRSLLGLQARARSRACMAPSLLAIDNVPNVFLPSGIWGSIGTVAMPTSDHWSPQ